MNKIAIALLSLGTLTATPAMAQEVNPTFTGPRVEGLVGYDHIGAGSSINNPHDDQNASGFLYGGAVGFDFAAGGAVIGVDAEYTDSTARVDNNNGSSGTQSNAFGFGRVETGRDLYVGARAGILATPRTLVYIKGGYTNARLNAIARDGVTELSGDYDLDGYRLGAGAEFAVTPKSYAKIEYRYSNYGDATFRVNGNDVAGFDVDTDRHQVLVGYGIRF